jgi:sulfopyruvate decarboxylase TPP-binding subunit
MTNHWENELEIIRLGRRAAHLYTEGNINTSTINTVTEACSVIDQVLTLMYEELQAVQDSEDDDFEMIGSYGGTI